MSMQRGEINPCNPHIKEQILLSCSYTSLMKLLGTSYSNIKKIAFGDHILYSYDLSGWETIDITRRNLKLIIVTAQRVT